MISVYKLDVPYSEKDEVKAMGARWDGDRRRWVIRSDNKYFRHACQRWWGIQIY